MNTYSLRLLNDCRNYEIDIEGNTFVLPVCHAQGLRSWRSKRDQSRIRCQVLMAVLGMLVCSISSPHHCYQQDVGLPGCWLLNAVSFMELPWTLSQSATSLFKQAICTAYAGHKPLTVSEKVVYHANHLCWRSFIYVVIHCVLLSRIKLISFSIPATLNEVCPSPKSGPVTT